MVKLRPTIGNCSISARRSRAGGAQRRRVMQWLTVAMLSRPPTSHPAGRYRLVYLLIVKPHGQRGALWPALYLFNAGLKMGTFPKRSDHKLPWHSV
ncbi:hypothetical protein KCP73_09175 [Salmonella enterica subsp. enterica]|nr:hypothetical protein KCP73_09175 [Salmonella enterica subsp. enterica]